MRIRDQILDRLKKARSALRVQRGRSLCKQAQEAYALSARAAKRRTR